MVNNSTICIIGGYDKLSEYLFKILKNLDEKGPWHQIYKDELNIK